ncbi:flavin reductase family protein [Gammaproteobacteria bacterium]|jgi:flavin reductase (DIM6/NTAB) family NADH-FMN oxidoreductase RutF|nr:flavin reductase family protein [Gammaproteobacteria bacterium]MDA9947316.1 flavin reductase family protein [bacterium]MDA8780878.1 flavin reductase family protein [Gammaproteobacteria bacterium]MDA9205409.1 flavin reductase family protein [Gammaproteobacteria bacterium]MDA9799493.1 flavin reductase family protein [Gammaproteobacteria bacterium]
MPKEQFLIAMRFLASSVSVISAKDSSGNLFAMTASSVTSLTMDPPSILVCVNNGATIHDVLMKGENLCINILQKTQQEISNICSSRELESTRFQNNFWDTSDIPFIKDSQANIFCKVDETVSYHTHKIVIGSVIHSQSAETFNTLMYADGGYLD